MRETVANAGLQIKCIGERLRRPYEGSQGRVMATGYLHIDGNEALGREAAKPHHWLLGLAIVIVAQWVSWQGAWLSPYVSYLWSTGVGYEATAGFVVSNLFVLLIPNALIVALALYASHRFDKRGASAIGLDASTPTLMFIWGIAGLVAAAPHLILIVLRGVGEGWLTGLLALPAITIVQAGAEETLFRGILLGFLCARYGARNGVLISALLFGFWHLYIGQQPIDAAISFVHTCIFGVTAAVLTLHYGNIGPALGLHVVWNVAGYFSGAAGGDEFWYTWASSYTLPWTDEGVANGDLARLLVFPLIIETLIILAVCRDTVRKLLGQPSPMNAG